MGNSGNLRLSRVLLGVTAGIAAYKAAELSRLLIKQGHQVQVVMTPGAKNFVHELTFQSITGNPVRHMLFDPAHEAAMGHIELARWAEFVLIAPASADFIAKLYAGMADTLLHTLCLAVQAPIAIAPAMNRNMWANPAVQHNIMGLQQRGMTIWGPAVGDQACGDVGPGRMLEPLELSQRLKDYCHSSTGGSFIGRKVLVTAGPTYEPLDPVRFIGNRSSGKMGFAIAQALSDEGADTVLIAGPVNLMTPQGCQRINVQTARQMYDAVMEHIQDIDVFIGCAAVADYRPEKVLANKIKKGDAEMQITLVKNPDILQSAAALSKRPFCVGFAAETENLEEYAKAKLRAKNIDMIAANQVGEDQGFESDENALLVFWLEGEKQLSKQTKSTLAKQLVELVSEQLNKD